MPKVFNVTAVCIPEKHYMVDISTRLEEIKKLVDGENYFTINRARQYGKTTVLRALQQYLNKDYCAILMDFQTFGSAEFKDENIFALSFAESFLELLKKTDIIISETLKSAIDELELQINCRNDFFALNLLFKKLSNICTACDKPIVLMIDEIDSAKENQVFLDFLAQFRAYYMKRDIQRTFQSVILAGVYDIKNLKRKLRSKEEHKMNSPWNIAADFKIDMSFSSYEIAKMLEEYEKDYKTGMDIKKIANLLYDYTSGYPFLVSKLCKLIDEEISISKNNRSLAWTRDGFYEAVRLILIEKNPLFESLIGKLEDYPELDIMIKSLLFTGKSISYNSDEPAIDTAAMFGFIKNESNMVVIANRIFETRLYNRYLSSAELQGLDLYKASLQDKNQFIVDGYLDMRQILEKFVYHFHELYGDSSISFVEEEGRKYFLLYLRPIINGIGNYYIEARTRELRRTDVIVDYRGEQYIIEMKIWHGTEYNNRGEEQLIGYLNDYHKKKGYMVSFNFNKKKEIGVKEVIIGDKVIIEAVV